MSNLKLSYESLEEIPEALRPYCEETTDDEGNKIIEYKAEAPVSALKKERSTKSEIERALKEKEAELQALKSQSQTKEPETKQEKDDQSKVLAEYDKRIRQLQEQLEKRDREAKQHTKRSFITDLGNQVGLQPGAAKLIEDEIGHDDKGFYVIDSDGTPMIDINGNRMNPRDYLESRKKSDPWMFRGKPSGPSENAGMSPKNRTIVDQLQKQAEQAREKGDVKTQIALARKVRRYGG